MSRDPRIAPTRPGSGLVVLCGVADRDWKADTGNQAARRSRNHIQVSALQSELRADLEEADLIQRGVYAFQLFIDPDPIVLDF